MRRRFLTSLFILLCLSVPAAGISLYPLPSPAVERAAARFKAKDFNGARQAALEAPPGPARDFIAGMAAAKTSRWEEAISHLDRAAVTLPLLGDYALYHKGKALAGLSRHREAAAVIETMLKQYPESTLHREALLLLGDSLSSDGNSSAALETYQKFIERYPSGNDSLTALYNSALCRERLGDVKGMVHILRTVWLTYPASTLAEKADADLKRLAGQGVETGTYSAEELLKRGTTLYDLRKFDLALATFTSLAKEAQNPDIAARATLKRAQTLFKQRHYRDAEEALSKLDFSSLRKGVAEEALYCLARSLDRGGRHDEAVATFLRLADTFPGSDLADNALLEAALVRRSQKQGAQAETLLSRLLSAYPQSNLKPNALWELAWDSYQGRRYGEAAEKFGRLNEFDGYRERALYWSGRALSAAGSEGAARAAFSTLLTDYPNGFYATYYRAAAKLDDPPQPAVPAVKARPVLTGFERERALIAFGMYEEARRELNSQKKKPSAKNGGLQAIAELYLEMGDYNGAFNAYLKDPASRSGKDGATAWNFTYPLAFSELVTNHSQKNRLSADLVFSIIRAESSYSPVAKSPVGAIGLMQLMPATAASMVKNRTLTTENLTEPGLNISLGTKHLRHLLNQYREDTALAVAAYNAGAGNVNRWKKNFGEIPQDEFIESIPFGETRDYVKKVLAAAAMYKRLYKLDSRSFPQTPPPVEEEQAADPPAAPIPVQQASSS